jgi:glutaminyl-tRNA synthetase
MAIIHIGHAKALTISFGIAEEYGGKCNLRFDDTNPTKENIEFVNSIKEDIHGWASIGKIVSFLHPPTLTNCTSGRSVWLKKGKPTLMINLKEDVNENRGT